MIFLQIYSISIFVKDNTKAFTENVPSFQIETEGTFQANFIYNLTLTNNGIFPLRTSIFWINLTNNESISRDFYFSIPSIDVNQEVNTLINVSLFSNPMEIIEFALFMQNITLIEYSIKIGVFLFPISINGRANHIDLISGGI